MVFVKKVTAGYSLGQILLFLAVAMAFSLYAYTYVGFYKRPPLSSIANTNYISDRTPSPIPIPPIYKTPSRDFLPEKEKSNLRTPSRDEETDTGENDFLLGEVSNIARFDFLPEDHIYFFHIPKTAGSAFTEVLRYLKLCPQPGGCGQPLLPNGEPDFEHPITGLEADCCCIYTCIGHFPLDDIDAKSSSLPQNTNMYTVTILRDPVGRVTSEFYYVYDILQEDLKPQFVPRKLYPAIKDGSLQIVDFVKIPDDQTKTKCCGTINNRQTMMLAGVDLNTARSLGDTKLLDLAKKNLLQMDYFGISDRWEDSIELLLWTFGQGDRTFEQSGLTWNRVHPHPKPNKEQQASIYEANYLDAKLLEFSHQVFEQRMKIMRAHKDWVENGDQLL